MKKFLLSLSLFAIVLSVVFFGYPKEADAATRVRGYWRNNGTYVQPHYRSDPDGYRWNNWSSRGNSNPYTGRRGHRSWWDY